MVDVAVRTVVGGDATQPAISMASMIAKTLRDQWIAGVADQLSLYGDLTRHQGYGTAAHRAAIVQHGWVRGFHRFSFLTKWKVSAEPSSQLI
jgi:ribonuclease HII